MVQSIYDSLIASDIPELFAEAGRSVTFRKVNMLPNDPGDLTAPVSEVTTDTITNIVEVLQEEDRRFGSNTEIDSFEVLIPANVIQDVRPNDEIIDDNGKILKVTKVFKFRPGRDNIMFQVQVRI